MRLVLLKGMIVMRLNRLAASAVVVAALAQEARAQSSSGSINVTASVTATCSLGPGPLHAATLDYSNPSVKSPTTVINLSTKTATFPNSSCNVATHVSLLSFSGGAVGGTPSVDLGHQNYFDYRAVASFGGAVVTLDTSAFAKGAPTSTVTSATTSSGPFTGDLTVSVTPEQPPLGLAAGAYADQVRVTLTAN